LIDSALGSEGGGGRGSGGPDEVLELQGDGRLSALRGRRFAVNAGIGA